MGKDQISPTPSTSAGSRKGSGMCGSALGRRVGGQRIGGRAGVWSLKSVSATSDLLPRFVLPTFTDCGLAARSQASSEALPAKLPHELSRASSIYTICGYAPCTFSYALMSLSPALNRVRPDLPLVLCFITKSPLTLLGLPGPPRPTRQNSSSTEPQCVQKPS